MKVSDAEWQWDRKKLTLYFTAEKRVDFRALVRDLAAAFRTRIELKQIGVRDEAKRLGGIGRCGREYCSASWLPELRPVNLQVAKDQHLSLNPSQISGACGRLMCCLRYEHDYYVQSRKRFPKEGRVLVTSLGEEKVLANDIFGDRVTLRGPEGDTRVVPLAELKQELEQRRERGRGARGGDGRRPSRRPRPCSRMECRPRPRAAPQRTRRAADAASGRDARSARRRIAGRTGVAAAAAAGAARVDGGESSARRARRRIAWREYYLTTAIDYANGDPHLGHAFEKIGADVIARYHRMLGRQRVVPDRDGRARPEGRADRGRPRAHAAGARRRGRGDVPGDVAQRSSISNDQFMRTTAPAHKHGVQALIERIFEQQPDDFYEKSYEG